MTAAFCCNASRDKFRSSSGTRISVLPSSAIVSKVRPGCTRSPGSTLRVNTVPATSARTFVLASCACSAARRSRSKTSSTLPGASAATLKRVNSKLLRATLSALSACSLASADNIAGSVKLRLRSASRRACSNCTFAFAKSTSACGRLLVANSVSAASACRT